MGVVASIKVTFGEGAEGASDSVVMEFDDVLNVDSAGEEITQWQPGDIIYFRIQHPPTVRLDSVKPTDGQVVGQGAVPRERVDRQLWTDLDDKQELGCIPDGGLTPKWYGNECSGLRKSGDKSVLVSSGVLPAQCDVTYSAGFNLYKLITRFVELGQDETWPVTIVAHFEPVIP